MSDRERLLATLIGVYAYYDRELTDLAVRVWLADLSDFDADAVDAAFVRHRRDPDRGRFLPKTADVLLQLHGDATELAQVAWGKVLNAARQGGGRFDDAPTQQALEAIGGMHGLRMAQESELGFLHRAFMTAFRAYKNRADRAPLALTHEVVVLRLDDPNAGPTGDDLGPAGSAG